MSYSIGIDTLRLRPTPRLAHSEYCSNRDLLRAVTGEDGDGMTPRFCDAWEIDLRGDSHDGPVQWSELGRTTDMGHADFLEGGVDRRPPKPSPFSSAEEVWAFDAVREYGLPPLADLTACYEQHYQQLQRAHPNQVVTAGYYKTLMSGAIEAFGWEMLLEAAADQRKFEKTLDSIFRLSRHHFQAWAQTSAEVFLCHDDMVWSEGPFLHPDFYRDVIFPRYRELWSILRQAGKLVLYCCDGNWAEFVDDIVTAGAHGFIFEPMLPLDPVVQKYGQSHVIIGSKVDARTLTFGTLAEIQAEIDATLELALACPGFMFAVGNHIPSNVPVQNAQFYFDYLHQHWSREIRP